MELRQGYKRTEVGVIPEDWDLKSLGEIGENIIGLTYSPNNVREYGHLVLRSSNIQNNKLAFENNVFVDMKLPNRVIVKEDDILICVRNGSKHLIGKCALIDKATEGSAFGAFMSVYRTPYAKYIFHQFQSNIIQKQIDEVMGATINQLTNKNLSSFNIPLPKDILEQNVIASTLSDMDALISQTEKLIEKKKAIKQGAMQELMKPKDGWVTKKFTDVVNYIHGKAHEQFIIENGKFEVVNSKFISTDGKVKKYSDQSFLTAKKGDVLTVLSDLPNGKALAKCFYVEHENKYAVNQRICIWRSINDYPKFLFYFLNRHEYFMALNDGVSQTHILNGHIEKFYIKIPDNYLEQQSIAETLWDIDQELQLMEKKLTKLKQQKQGMMQALLTGKIRLV
jgi:type I restriction enzyme S subunit